MNKSDASIAVICFSLNPDLFIRGLLVWSGCYQTWRRNRA